MPAMTTSAEDREFYRWYGPWTSPTPGEVAGIMRGLQAPWWIVGGWAIDAFSGRHREHDDIDIGFFRADLPAVLDVFAPDYCVWSNLGGTLRPLKRAEDLLEGCRQLWVRRDGGTPWLIDLAMTPGDGDEWVSPLDDQLAVPLDDAVFVGTDSVRYLRPELVLAFKARNLVRHDDADLEATLPSMTAEARAVLAAAVIRIDAAHPWLERIAAGPTPEAPC